MMTSSIEQVGVHRRQGLTAVPTVLFIVALWVLEFSLLTAERLAMDTGDPPKMLIGRALTSVVGILLSVVIWRIHRSQSSKPLWFRVVTALLASLIASGIHAAANFGIFQLIMPRENLARATLFTYLSGLNFWFWSYLGISGLLLAVVYSTELAQRERDVSRLEQLAHTAQLRALRYQINPHFMFNTLNSIAALICTGKNPQAERMVENLGDFLRASLATDPQDDHPLAREVELQSLYLEIEMLRYPDRVAYSLEIDPAAEKALVPSLILQPLTENVFRHAVAVSSTLIELKIGASVRDGKLHIEVTNSAPSESTRPTGGTRVGLKNVEERLQARFGEAQSFTARRGNNGAFTVELQLPLEIPDGQ